MIVHPLTGLPVINSPSNDNNRDLPKTAAEFAYSGTELGALSSASNYYRWLLRKFEPYLGPTVIEVGAGIGTFAESLLSIPVIEKLVAIEPAANTYPVLAKRLAGNPRAILLKGYLQDYMVHSLANSLIAVNVLEHVEDDAEFLRLAWEAVAPGGTLLLFVPAVPAIAGSLDRAFEHFRRYTKPTLQQRIEAAGWEIEKIEYVNLPGVLFWFVAGRMLGWTSISEWSARWYDRFVVPLTQRLESLVDIPIGQSLLAVARKPTVPA